MDFISPSGSCWVYRLNGNLDYNLPAQPLPPGLVILARVEGACLWHYVVEVSCLWWQRYGEDCLLIRSLNYWGVSQCNTARPNLMVYVSIAMGDSLKSDLF